MLGAEISPKNPKTKIAQKHNIWNSGANESKKKLRVPLDRVSVFFLKFFYSALINVPNKYLGERVWSQMID